MTPEAGSPLVSWETRDDEPRCRRASSRLQQSHSAVTVLEFPSFMYFMSMCALGTEKSHAHRGQVADSLTTSVAKLQTLSRHPVIVDLEGSWHAMRTTNAFHGLFEHERRLGPL